MYSAEDLSIRFGINDMTGLQRELAEAIGVRAALKLCEAFGHSQIYVGNDRLQFAARAQDIHEGFYRECLKTSELAFKYGVTERTVRRIASMRKDQTGTEFVKDER